LRLLEHLARLPASRTFCTAGNKSAIKTAMMAMTTSSSISVKPFEARVTWRKDARGNMEILRVPGKGPGLRLEE